MMLEASGNIALGAKIKYLRILLCGEALHEFVTLCTKIGNTTSAHLQHIMMGLGTYFSVNVLSNKNV